MAIAAGDEVALARNPAKATLAVRGNVLFGLALNTDVDVIWENGQQSDAVVTTQLDKILGTDNPLGGGKVVTFVDSGGDNKSPEYRCVVVRGYSRQLNAVGDVTEYVLMKSLASGQLYEVLETQVEVV